jgi:hypothetical protein
MVVLTPNSVASTWVRDEFNHALNAQNPLNRGRIPPVSAPPDSQSGLSSGECGPGVPFFVWAVVAQHGPEAPRLSGPTHAAQSGAVLRVVDEVVRVVGCGPPLRQPHYARVDEVHAGEELFDAGAGTQVKRCDRLLLVEVPRERNAGGIDVDAVGRGV